MSVYKKQDNRPKEEEFKESKRKKENSKDSRKSYNKRFKVVRRKKRNRGEAGAKRIAKNDIFSIICFLKTMRAFDCNFTFSINRTV